MRTGTETGLVPRLRAEGISWRCAGGFLEVRLDLANESPEPTEDAQLVIETAPLGAFVPFKPGTRLAVAGFDPWERRRVTAMIPADRLERTPASPDSVSSPLEVRNDLSRRGFRWAGNLNVYFDRAPEESVEVHRALDLEVRAGQRVGLFFMLAAERLELMTGAHQSYAMEARSSDPAWIAEVQPIGPVGGVLLVAPPAESGLRATVEVLVTRLRDGRTVPVVFTMETVAGQGGTLGCLRI